MALFKINSSENNNKIAKTMANCFHEPISLAKFFLYNKTKASKCYTCTSNSDIVSVLHSIPYKIKLNKNQFNCSYLYGACTAPMYQRQGYMKKLIKFYDAQSKLNGFDFSALIPDNKYLENYYQKLGYENFFKIKEVILNKEQLLKLCNSKENIEKEKNENHYKNFYKIIEKLRLDIYNNISNVLYSSHDIEYAAKLYGFVGGKFINIMQGYAICTPISKDTVEIRDFTCQNEFIPFLLQKIYIGFPEYTNFKIKTNPNDTFFKENSKIYFCGMIKAISNSGKQALKEFELTKKHEAYLGLALD